jgi:threonine/homoserine/homoserine lactone efflux protein
LATGALIVLSTIQLVLTGLGIGILVAAPVGPVNILCIQRTISRGFLGGLAAGLGAVIGDGLLAAIAAFGMTAISDVMVGHSLQIQFIGGLILVAFGVALMLATPAMAISPGQKSHFWDHTGVIPQTFFLTVTNPGAILGMLAIFGGLGSLIGGLASYVEALVLVVSVMAGSLLWWIGLATLITKIRHKLTEGQLHVINRLAGTVLMGFGIVLIVQAVWRYWF